MNFLKAKSYKLKAPSASGRAGQSLVEILVAISIGVLIIGAAVLSIGVALRSNTVNVSSSFASPLAKELLEKARVIAEGKWTDIYNQPKGADLYIVPDTGGVPKIIAGQEGILSDDIQNGLVGYWKLDEASGTTAYDVTANNNKGTLTNGAAPTSGCKVGGCLNFDGVDDYVNLGDPVSDVFDFGAGEFTISFWIFRDSNSTTNLRAVSKGGNSNSVPGWGFFGADNLITFMIGDGTPRVGVSADITPSAWYHIVGTRSGFNIKIYKNGVLGNSTNSAPAGSVSNSLDLRVGNLYDNTLHWDGRFDEVRIYNRALSATEVGQLYNSRPYTRSFKIENVFRDGSGNIVASGGTEDPSTQKIIATVRWGDNSSLSINEYITRSRNEVNVFSDWSEGTYASQSGIDTETSGKIKLLE